MKSGYFYFLSDKYCEQFADCGIMGNKESDQNGEHGRPCFYCYEYDGFYWFIPISSRITKYKSIYSQKILRYPNYDGIRFGYVNGKESAFLIQNMCPAILKYIDKQYFIERGTVPVKVNDDLSKELNKLAEKVIKLNKKGIKITITNINEIIKKLNEEN